LYRSCDVLVHPYRGEGFAMPVLEAMASGIPPIVTGGGPTDEFCPPEVGWRIKASRAEFQSERVGNYDTVGRPWVLEPDAGHLAELLRAAAADPDEVARRGTAARAAAERYGWNEIAGRDSARMVALLEGVARTHTRARGTRFRRGRHPASARYPSVARRGPPERAIGIVEREHHVKHKRVSIPAR
jgi:glycosyltransferase involved in cell wall biosynthesis